MSEHGYVHPFEKSGERPARRHKLTSQPIISLNKRLERAERHQRLPFRNFVHWTFLYANFDRKSIQAIQTQCNIIELHFFRVKPQIETNSSLQIPLYPNLNLLAAIGTLV